jgi:hypothetical protein
MSDNLPRRGFLRQLCRLPLIGGGVALLGAPTAVAEPVTPDLIDAYSRWLQLEHFLLMEEQPQPAIQMPPRPPMDGWDESDIRGYLGAEQRLFQVRADFQADWCNFRARAGMSAGGSPVERFFMNRDRAIVSSPASTRAALVLSTVGCDWRA